MTDQRAEDTAVQIVERRRPSIVVAEVERRQVIDRRLTQMLTVERALARSVIRSGGGSGTGSASFAPLVPTFMAAHQRFEIPPNSQIGFSEEIVMADGAEIVGGDNSVFWQHSNG